MIITPKNWHEFQHYHDRRPAWIKLHRSILDDYEFHQLPDASKALAMCLWLVASEGEDGQIDANYEKLAFRFRTSAKKIEDSLKPLIDLGFFLMVQPDDDLLAGCYQDACLEKREETEKRESKPRTKGTRLSTDWSMPAEWGNWALGEKPEWDNGKVIRVADDFRDYWIAKPGAIACKLDWLATWRKWVRNTK